MATRCLCCLKEITSESCPHCGYPKRSPNESHQLPVGSFLRKRYQIGRVLGQGGFGITYLAWDSLLRKAVAIKEFYPDGTVYRRSTVSLKVECTTERMIPHYEYSRERFLREASALVDFRDIPEIVDILDFVEENNTAYIVMEFVKGVDLAKYVRRKGGKLDVGETFRILKPVMQALAKVHKSGIVHRDISPDNIILDPVGGAKLLDFGAVRAVESPDMEKQLSKSTEAILKQGFAPLEQYNTRGSLGPWTDEYAMCGTVWYCLTGKVPEEAMLRMLEGTNPDWSSIPDLPKHQQKALEKGFSLMLNDRFPDMDTLLAALFPSPEENAQEQDEINLADDESDLSRTVSVSNTPVTVSDGNGIHPTPIDDLMTRKEIQEEKGVDRTDDILLSDELVTEKHKQGNTSGSRKKWKFLVPTAAALIIIPVVLLTSRNMVRYEKANELMEAGQYAQAAVAFEALGGYKNSANMAQDCYNIEDYLRAEEHLKNGDYYHAATEFYSVADFGDAQERALSCWRYFNPQTLSAGLYHTVGLAADGTVVAAGQNDYGQCDVANWKDIVSISAGSYHTVGLKANGTVVAVGWNNDNQCDVSNWQDIVAISAGENHTVGLKADGTVVAVGLSIMGACDVTEWKDIVAVSAGNNHTVGLKTDGTVVAVGSNYYNQCDISTWKNIIAVSAGAHHTVGLMADGIVVAAGQNDYGQCDVVYWKDITAINAGAWHTVGLKADSTVVAVGIDSLGRCDVTEWKNIVAVSAGSYHTVGLKSDGTVVAVGSNFDGECNVSKWKNIRIPG